MTVKSKSKAKSKPAKKTAAKKKAAPKPKPKAKAKTPKVETHETGVQSIKGTIAHSLFVTAQTDDAGVLTGRLQIILKSDDACLGFLTDEPLVMDTIRDHLNVAIFKALSPGFQSQTASSQ